MKLLLASFCMLSALVFEAQASTSTKVIATIAPLHSLVQGVMGNTGQADLLVQAGASPHDVQLKPSQMKLLQGASIIFYIDDNLETFLPKALDMTSDSVRKIAMLDQPDIELKELRDGGNWEAHSHESHKGHAEHDDHGHSHGANVDVHIWLDPMNAKSMIKTIAKELSKIDPQNRSEYKANARTQIALIEASDEKIRSVLAPYQKAPFIVFHDAYQYFEKRYHLNAVGSIVIDPTQSASVKRVATLRKKVTDLNVRCVFREPQFTAKVSNVVIEGSGAKLGTLDPVGASLTPGQGLYVKLLENMAHEFASCFSK